MFADLRMFRTLLVYAFPPELPYRCTPSKRPVLVCLYLAACIAPEQSILWVPTNILSFMGEFIQRFMRVLLNRYDRAGFTENGSTSAGSYLGVCFIMTTLLRDGWFSRAMMAELKIFVAEITVSCLKYSKYSFGLLSVFKFEISTE